MTHLTLDLMDLADVGGQPRKLAAEIHRQIRAQAGNLPLPLPLASIAAAAGITEIIDRPTTSFEGTLVTSPDKSQGVVVLRAGMPRGRRNFTLGHEIGHMINPYHRPSRADGFVCVSRDMHARRRGNVSWDKRPALERMEVEANEFSVSLLVPAQEFQQQRAKLSGCDLGHIEPLARLFGTSKEVMARIYVDTSPERIAMLTSQYGKVQRLILPDRFPYLGLKKDLPLPPRSLSASFLGIATPGQLSGLCAVRADAWLESSKAQTELCEQTLAQRDGWAMTMLTLDEPDEDEEEEEAEVELRWAGARFAYGR